MKEDKPIKKDDLTSIIDEVGSYSIERINFWKGNTNVLKYFEEIVPFTSHHLSKLVNEKFRNKFDRDKAISYIVDITSPNGAKILNSADEIPGFNKTQLDPDFRNIKIGKYQYKDEDSENYDIHIIYTYTQFKGVLKRYKFKFYNITPCLTNCDILEIENDIGDAKFPN